MTHSSKFKLATVALAAFGTFHAPAALACAACFGKSDSPLAQGMNWGIFALLGCISMVLSGFAGFGIYLARRSAAVAAAATTPPAPVEPAAASVGPTKA
jgi:hypothetical protein